MRTHNKLAIKAMVYCAMLAAISVVMARILCFATPDGVRWSLDKFPLFLAGMFFGPMAGALTGFVADFTGSLMQFGLNPLLCLPAILYGLFGGLMRRYIQKNTSVLRIGVSYLLPVVIGSVLHQSCMLTLLYFPGVELNSLLHQLKTFTLDSTFMKGFAYYLGTRSIQFSIMLVAETLIIYALMKTNVFTRLGVWPPKAKIKKEV